MNQEKYVKLNSAGGDRQEIEVIKEMIKSEEFHN